RKLNCEKSINIKQLVNITEGATGADIKAICTEAGMFAIRNDRDTITQEDFLKATDKVLKKIRDKTIESRLYS
ncbi:MAG: proteasome-activating nucleotidase, partial [Promethearchaeota archaeon]